MLGVASTVIATMGIMALTFWYLLERAKLAGGVRSSSRFSSVHSHYKEERMRLV